MAPDFLVKQSGVLDVPPRPKSPSDDPLLLKASFTRRSVSLSQNSTNGSELDSTDHEEPLHSVDEEMAPGTPVRSSQYTPIRSRNEDVAMSSPSAGSPSPTERKVAVSEQVRAGSVPAAVTSRISLFGPKSLLRNAPNSVGRTRSTALPMLPGRLAQGTVDLSADSTNIAGETAHQVADKGSPSPQASEEEQSDPLSSTWTHAEVQQPAEQLDRLQSPGSEAQQPERHAGAPAAADVDDYDLDQDDWLPADEWIMNERDSVTPGLRDEPETQVVDAASAWNTEEDVDPEHRGEVNQDLAACNTEISPGQPLAGQDEPPSTPRHQFPQRASSKTPKETSSDASVPARKRTTVVIKLDITTIKVEPEEYGVWSNAALSGQSRGRAEVPGPSSALLCSSTRLRKTRRQLSSWRRRHYQKIVRAPSPR